MTNTEILFRKQSFSFMIHINDSIFSITFKRNTVQMYVKNICCPYNIQFHSFLYDIDLSYTAVIHLLEVTTYCLFLFFLFSMYKTVFKLTKYFTGSCLWAGGGFFWIYAITNKWEMVPRVIND